VTAQSWGRAWFALTALVAAFALALQVAITAGYQGGHFPTVSGRVLNLFCFFTIQSNVLVGATSLVLATRPSASSTLFRVVWFVALVDITITALVYHTVLASLEQLEGHAATADLLLHTVVPIMAVAGWLLFGPRGFATARVAGWALLIPIAWMVLTLVRGPIVDYYPYPFLDVRDLGYARVLLNAASVALLFVGLATATILLDRWLGPVQRLRRLM
jgi:hypothetical protein